jgi:hypothetical protein
VRCAVAGAHDLFGDQLHPADAVSRYQELD